MSNVPAYPGDRRPEIRQRIADARVGNEEAIRELQVELLLKVPKLPVGALCDVWETLTDFRDGQVREIRESN